MRLCGRIILDGEWRFGLPEEISSEDWNVVIAYAHLAEGIGIEKLSRGVDEALLPASKDRLRHTLALASRSRRRTRDLKPDDLPKLYGCLDLFLPKVELDAIAAALAIEEALEDRAPTEQELELMEAALSNYEKAAAGSLRAAERLQAHAKSIC
jgi:hypothetical protein